MNDLKKILCISLCALIALLILLVFFLTRSKIDVDDRRSSFHVFDFAQLFCFINILVQKTFEDARNFACEDTNCTIVNRNESFAWDWVVQLVFVSSLLFVQLILQNRIDKIAEKITFQTIYQNVSGFLLLYCFSKLIAVVEFVLVVYFWKESYEDEFYYVNFISFCILSITVLCDCVYTVVTFRSRKQKLNVEQDNFTSNRSFKPFKFKIKTPFNRVHKKED